MLHDGSVLEDNVDQSDIPLPFLLLLAELRQALDEGYFVRRTVRQLEPFSESFEVSLAPLAKTDQQVLVGFHKHEARAHRVS
jgi:hypothetical protein